MPRYFFHVHNHIEVEDEEGQLLPDEAAARAAALESVRELICESVREGRLDRRHYIQVTDADGREVLVLSFGEAFALD